jgi:hypothetical protein
MSGHEHEPEPGRRGMLVALVVIVVLVLGGLWISHVLRSSAAVQDCVMQGRSNCAPVR